MSASLDREVEQLNRRIAKRQRALMSQITTREMKIAALRAEQDALRRELADCTGELVMDWATS